LTDVDARTPRADAARNRDMLLAAATRAFASADEEPSMRAIAREAGVGIATLYRHFPTRESLVDAVYQDQVKRLTAGARELLGQLPPATALRRWMDLFADWLATKHGMLDTLLAMVESGEIAPAQTRAELLDAITTILDAGRAAGDLRADVTAEDIAASLLGILTVAGRLGNPAQASRLLDLLMDGLRRQEGPRGRLGAAARGRVPLVAVAQDQDRAMGVQHALQADRADDSGGEAAQPPAADHEQVRVARPAHQHVGRMPLGDDGANRHARLRASLLLEDLGERLAGDVLKVGLGSRHPVNRPGLVLPGHHRVDGGAGQPGLVNRPAQRRP
jgi:AcrR family transcriptional regulator